jgi:hypothetical protein
MKRIKSGKWVAVAAGAITAAIVGAAAGCMNALNLADWEGTGDAAAVDAAAAGAAADRRGPAGLREEEFTLTLHVGEEEGSGGRSVMGPDAGGIELGKIRNTAQVIVVDAETRVVKDQDLVRKGKDNEDSAPLAIKVETGKKYHFLVLMGHTERTYGEAAGSPIAYVSGAQPTLLAAGFLADQAINGATTLNITMAPLLVDTAFTYGGVTAQAAAGGNELPAGVEAGLVWTLTGGLAALAQAQNTTGLPSGGGTNWGALNLAEGKTVLRFAGESTDTEAPAVLSGAGHDRVTLALGARAAGVEGSANFRLTYHPLGQSATPWILRNGVNDKAQDKDTTFTPNAGGVIPWGTAYNDEGDTYNGNGAVAFTSVQGSVDLTGFVPAPSVGATPQTTFFTSQYIGKVKWIPEHSTFQAGVAYNATVTLDPAAGHVFSSSLTASHGGAASTGVTHEYDLSAYVPPPMRGENPQRQGENVWADYSTDKWSIQVWWYRHDTGVRGDDGPWYGTTTDTLTGNEYGAAIILKPKTGYSFDKKIDFKYPAYADNGKNPLRGYYKFDPANKGQGYVTWWWQNGNDHKDPPPEYDTAPSVLYYRPADYPDTNYPVNIRGTSYVNDVLQEKDRDKERLVMVGFNTQDDVPTFIAPPEGGPEGGVRLVTLGFKPIPIPSNVDSGGDTFSQAIAMIRAAKQTGAGYLSLKLNGLTKDGKGKDTADTSVAAVSFSIADSPSAVVIDGGNRVVEGTDLNQRYITVGNGVTLTLRNITLKAVTNPSVVRVASGGVLILEEGAVITGHTTTYSEGGGGVYVAGGGTLIMKGGEISGNTATAGSGGAVYVEAGGAFTMSGGTIKNNTANSGGGGVYVAAGGTFTMQAGALSENTADINGGGVYVAGSAGGGGLGGTFSMQGGTIGGNKATGGSGGGVYAAGPAGGGGLGGTFVKSLGTIYGGGVDANANYAATYNGHAAYAEDGPRKRNAAAGPGVPLNSGTAANWEFPALTDSWATTGTIASNSQVDWYTVTAASAGSYLLEWDDGGNGTLFGSGADILVEATRGGPNGESVLAVDRHDHGYNDGKVPPPFELAAGETLLVQVKGKNDPTGIGDYKIRCVPVPEISASWTAGNLAAGTATWYRLRPGTAGTYQIQWEDSAQHGTGPYGADIKIAAFRSATYPGQPYKGVFEGNVGGIDNGYTDPPGPIEFAEGEIIYVVVMGNSENTYGTYRIRGYQCWDGNISKGTTQWYTFTAGTSGTYFLQWEDQNHQANGKVTPYTGVIDTVSAYRGPAPLLIDETTGYPGHKSLGWLNAGETVSVKVVGTGGSTYIVRFYR